GGNDECVLGKQGGQGFDWPEDARWIEVRRLVPVYLQFPADQILQDRSPRQHDHTGPANQERPLGADEGRPDVLTTDTARAGQSELARASLREASQSIGVTGLLRRFPPPRASSKAQFYRLHFAMRL